MKLSARLLHATSWLAIVGLLVNLGLTLLKRSGVRAETRSPSAYTAVLKETAYDAQGHARPGMLVTWSVRSDGSQSMRMETNRLNERVIDSSSGERILVDDRHRLKSTEKYKSEVADLWLRNAAANCLTAEEERNAQRQSVPQSDTVGAYRAVKVVRGKLTTWYAPEHGCAMIQSAVDWGDGSRGEQRLVSLEMGEPTAAMFSTDSYLEATPSQMRCAFGSDLERSCDLTPQEVRAMDARYYSHRP